MIPIRFAYLIAYFVRRNDDDGSHRWTEFWCRDTAATGATRERRESAQKKEDRGEVPRKTAAGGRAATTSSFMQLPHRQLRYRKLRIRALAALRLHVWIRITAPCPRRTSGLLSRQHTGLRRPPPAAPWHTTASSARYKVSKRGW